MYLKVSNIVCLKTFSVKRKEYDLHRQYTFLGRISRKCIFSYNFTARTKFMILFHLQRLGAQRCNPRFFNFWKIKCRKWSWIFIFQILRFYAIVCGFVLFFFRNKWKIIFGRLQRYWQLNSIQNDVWFNHLGQKLRENIHFLQPKVNFSGEGKNTSIWTMSKIYNVRNNKNCLYIMFLFLHWWNNIKICQKNKFHLAPSPNL